MIQGILESLGRAPELETCYTDVMRKKELGQFFTTNVEHILQGFEEYVKGKNVTDPFAGGQDLMKWAEKNGAKRVGGYDVDPRYVDGKAVKLNDTLLIRKKYDFVITNPPYLNINKASKAVKEKYFEKYGFEDLYHLSLAAISNSKEGIVIVPINFLSAENSVKIRKLFFDKFRIVQMNYFRKQVFPDTTYNVIAFYYKQWGVKESGNFFTIKTHIFPENESLAIALERKFDWIIGGAVLKRIQEQDNALGIRRLVEGDLILGKKEMKAAYNHVKEQRTFKVAESVYDLIKQNIILLRAIDSGTKEGKIKLEDIRSYGFNCLVSKESSRNMIYLVFENRISQKDQLKIVELFNQEIEKMRKDYLSLFLTNFRDNDRKRISFDFVYKFINYLYYSKLNRNYSGQQPILVRA